jgi:hypothetical protein
MFTVTATATTATAAATATASRCLGKKDDAFTVFFRRHSRFSMFSDMPEYNFIFRHVDCYDKRTAVWGTT